MTSERALSIVFIASNLSVLPFWLLMWLAPHEAFTRRVIGSVWICVPFTILYAVLLATQLGAVGTAARTFSLAGVAAVLGTPGGTTLAWAHYLAADLFVGRWMYLDGIERNASRPFVLVVLLVGFAVGPLGLLIHLVFRPQKTGSTLAEADGPALGSAGRTALLAPSLQDLSLDGESPAVGPSPRQ